MVFISAVALILIISLESWFVPILIVWLYFRQYLLISNVVTDLVSK